ncbi:hypothetical protein BZ166_12525 (plasmid) [Staphylococcus cohnii]|nr:hypothetical protein BZ166_12525 [Staphylococcus cohnii]
MVQLFKNRKALKDIIHEYSLISHFKQNSIYVKPGEKVDANTILGKCGNSGNSYESHIHFQIMNVPSIFNNSESLKINFSNLSSPIQGHIVGR